MLLMESKKNFLCPRRLYHYIDAEVGALPGPVSGRGAPCMKYYYSLPLGWIVIVLFKSVRLNN
jgi:hypothetical protein